MSSVSLVLVGLSGASDRAPGLSSPLPAPGSDVSDRSDRELTLRRFWRESLLLTADFHSINFFYNLVYFMLKLLWFAQYLPLKQAIEFFSQLPCSATSIVIGLVTSKLLLACLHHLNLLPSAKIA